MHANRQPVRDRDAVTILPTAYQDALEVVMDMRDGDRREVMALRPPEHYPDTIAIDLTAPAHSGLTHLAFCAKVGDAPVAVVGGMEYRPTLWSVYMIATDRFGEVALSVHRFVRRALLPTILQRGGNRAECRSLADHAHAHRWLERLGAVHEADLIDCGPGRETFRLYAWRRRDFEDV